MPHWTLRVRFGSDAERHGLHYHAERGNDHNMGKQIGEGYKRGGLEYGKQTDAVVILNNNGDPITSYVEF